MIDRRYALGLGLATALAAPLAGCATLPAISREETVAQARAAELAFAQTMADRNLGSFGALIAADAVFINGGKPLRGRAAIVEHWQRFFQGARAPFSWAPDLVEVLVPGQLAYTEGPVRAPDGTVFARFYTVWQRETDGAWRVLMDNGYEACKPKA